MQKFFEQCVIMSFTDFNLKIKISTRLKYRRRPYYRCIPVEDCQIINKQIARNLKTRAIRLPVFFIALKWLSSSIMCIQLQVTAIHSLITF